MSRHIPALLLVALSFANVSCQPDKDDLTPAIPPLPAPVYEMYSLVNYPATNETSGTRYSTTGLKGEARQENGRTVLNFNSGVDARALVQFVMPGSFVLGKPGSFTHQSLPAPAADAVQATYTISLPLGPNSQRVVTFQARNSVTEGNVAITAYDAANRLISGNYELRIKDVPDPYGESYPNTKKTTVVVGGTFSNLPVVP